MNVNFFVISASSTNNEKGSKIKTTKDNYQKKHKKEHG